MSDECENEYIKQFDNGLAAPPTRAGRAGDSQELPTQGKKVVDPVLWSNIAGIAGDHGSGSGAIEQLKFDLDRRTNVGIERYGTPLMTFNGRDASLDAYEEAQDLCKYLCQMVLENPSNGKFKLMFFTAIGVLLDLAQVRYLTTTAGT